MKSVVVLEMINNGEIDLLKELLAREVYEESLARGGGAKNRYAAMKRFFKFELNGREMYQKPCRGVEVFGVSYNSFIDGYTFALTVESTGTLDALDNPDGYFKFESIISECSHGEMEEVDLNAVLADGKSKGYKFKKSEVVLGDGNQYLLKYKDAYLKFGLFDKAFSVVNDGQPARVYYTGETGVLLIETSVGMAGICPLRVGDPDTAKVVICAAGKSAGG